MEACKLRQYIWQGIRKEVYPDRIDFYIPFCFPGTDDHLCLSWDAKGVLSDKGRTMAELKCRVKDISPYMDHICKILNECGCRLVAGQIVVKDSFQTMICGEDTYLDYLGGMHHMLKAISRIAIVDTLETLSEGEVSG